MADLDSRSKRASSVRILKHMVLAMPLPDGSIAQADRAHTVGDYSGITPAAVVGKPVYGYVIRMMSGE